MKVKEIAIFGVVVSDSMNKIQVLKRKENELRSKEDTSLLSHLQAHRYLV